MGLRQRSRVASLSWIQMSAVLVNVYKHLGLGGYITDPIFQETIHSMGAVFVDNTDLYTGEKDPAKSTNLWIQTQINVDQWNSLLQATGDALRSEK